MTYRMLNYLHDEIMYVEKLACSFQCMSKKLHCEKCAGRTTTFRGACSNPNRHSFSVYLNLWHCQLSIEKELAALPYLKTTTSDYLGYLSNQRNVICNVN